MINIGIQSTVLTDNEPRFTYKFLATLCKELGIKTVKTNEYHPHADRQVALFNTTMILRLRHYMTERHEPGRVCVSPDVHLIRPSPPNHKDTAI